MVDHFPYVEDIPDHIETDRLRMTFPRRSDADAMQAALEESRQHLKAWMPFWAQTHEVTTLWLSGAAERVAARSDYPMLVWRKADGRFLGGTGCHARSTAVPSAEVGYWLRASATGQGYATEAARAVVTFAFDVLNAHRVEIRCDARNTASAAVPLRLGFAREGRLRAAARTHHGELRDTLVFGMLRPEWKK
jgi:RimJ/RimL family protein N-acetyltransferase